ncbi:unnamed protein product [Dibothriocephalus latus]|uniref:Uncharacterized protein n=1 Tax=Dibothriocephalus latus TaxID=60516 RepID=A0A3P7N360_DIBLA|nr:unnamed protein product [Dibothriocephalus latus]
MFDVYGGDPVTVEYVLSLLTFVESVGPWARREITKKLDAATSGLHSQMLASFLAAKKTSAESTNWMSTAGLTWTGRYPADATSGKPCFGVCPHDYADAARHWWPRRKHCSTSRVQLQLNSIRSSRRKQSFTIHQPLTLDAFYGWYCGCPRSVDCTEQPSASEETLQSAEVTEAPEETNESGKLLAIQEQTVLLRKTKFDQGAVVLSRPASAPSLTTGKKSQEENQGSGLTADCERRVSAPLSLIGELDKPPPVPVLTDPN